MRIFKIAAGVILILTGVFCFANPGATFLSIAFLLGFSMLLSGLSGTLAAIWLSRKGEGSNSLMIEGLTNIILGGLVLSNQLLADAAIPVFFGVWVIFTGVIRIVEGYANRRSGRLRLIWFLSLGALGIAAGLYSFHNTVLLDFSVIMLAGILFVVQGFSVLMVGVNLSFQQRHRSRRSETSHA